MLTRPELLGIASLCDHEPMVSLMVRAMWLPGPSWGQKPVPRAEVTRSGGDGICVQGDSTGQNLKTVKR